MLQGVTRIILWISMLHFLPNAGPGVFLSADAGAVEICCHTWLKISLHKCITTKLVLHEKSIFKKAFGYSLWIENTIFIKKGHPVLISGRHKAIAKFRKEVVNVSARFWYNSMTYWGSSSNSLSRTRGHSVQAIAGWLKPWSNFILLFGIGGVRVFCLKSFMT